MIVLVNPPFLSKSTYMFSYNKARYAHLGLAYLAGYLEKKRIDFKVIDAKFFDLSQQEIVDSLIKNNPEIIGITSTTTEINGVKVLSEKIKKRLPESFLILGGVHGTAIPAETLESNDNLDAVVVGEGETVLERLSSAKNAFDAIADIPGVYFRDGDKIVHTERQ